MTKTIIFQIVLTLAAPAMCQVSFDNLEQVGVMFDKPKFLKITGPASTATIIIKLIPTLGTMESCGTSAVNEYKKTLDTILIPLRDTINKLSTDITVVEGTSKVSTKREKRFVGIAIAVGAVALATSAQITAGIALSNTIKNAEAIESIKSSIQASNQAIQKVIDAQGRTVTVINGIQDHINSVINPALNQLGCDVAKNTLAISLTQYFSKLSLLFGPNLRNPVEQPLSVQAIAGLMDGDINAVVSQLGYTQSDLLDLLSTESIVGTVTAIDMVNYMIQIEMSFPQYITIPDTKVLEGHKITFNDKGSEWQTQVPSTIAVRDILIAGVDPEGCSITSTSYICKNDPTYAMSEVLTNCFRGKTQECPRARITSTFATRFAIARSTVIANCVAAVCLCGDPGTPVVQKAEITLTAMTLDQCNLITVDGLQIKPSKSIANVTANFGNITLGPVVSVGDLDLSAELTKVQSDLKEAQDKLDESNAILQGINNKILTAPTSIALIVVSVVIVLLIIGIISWLIFLTRAVKRSSIRSERVTPSTYNNLGFIK
nr:fusion glycoprotein [Ferlavirus reptilis]